MVAAGFALSALSAGFGTSVRQILPPSSSAMVAVSTYCSDFLNHSLSLPLLDGAGASPLSPTGGSSLSVFNSQGDRKTEKRKHFNHSFGDVSFCFRWLFWRCDGEIMPKVENFLGFCCKRSLGTRRRGEAIGAVEEDKYDDEEIVKIEIDECLFS